MIDGARTVRRLVVAALGTFVAAPAHSAPSRATLPLIYTACASAPGNPTRIAVRDSPKGPVVDYERPGLPRQETADVNLAFISRRLFFKLKVEDELIEFQGRADDDRLDGTLSDERGARHIVMRIASDSGSCMPQP